MPNRAHKLTPEQVFKRAGGRRRYNRERHEVRQTRFYEVSRLWALYGDRRGTQARIARELGVSRATICRDVQCARIFAWALKHPAKALKELYGW